MLVHNGSMRTKLPPPTQEIRLTIPVSAEVHDTFTRIAKAANMPVGRAMGEWLADTLDAASFMAQTMEKARSAPRLVAQELHSYALGIGDQTKELVEALRAKGAADRGAAVAGGGVGPTATATARAANKRVGAALDAFQFIPPPCNTGGKVPGGKKPKPQRGVL